ncbi:MAG: hypothetical protein Q7U47_08210 [Paludibacter sp.]|nr:hypothetical protein [Paludibacter sp.]
MKKTIAIFAATLLTGNVLFAQFRATDKTGINVFEVPKTEMEFDGVKVVFGGGFTQGFQTLKHSNLATPKLVSGVDQNKLTRIRPGFNLASANLLIKTQLADGVALNMELYLASRHHNETWVKGGYIQFDKVPFMKLDFIDNIMKYTTVKVGQMEVNYGDAHFRRTDGGNAIYNPFIENNILDEFATEVGMEANVNYHGIVGVASITNGLLKANISVIDSTFNISTTPKTLISAGKNNPAFIAKLGYDKQLNEDLRFRLTGSVYYTAGAVSNTLLSGDRAGSNYFGVMDFSAPSTANFTTGRYNPRLTDKISALMGNLFVKFHGLEWFTTVESISGRSITEATGERKVTQIATDLVYRFGSDENFWVGARYNVVNSQQYLATDLPAIAVSSTLPAFDAVTKGMYDVNINRLAISAGWFLTKNVMAKLEYSNQNYGGFLYNDIRNKGNFNGIVAQAVVGF